MPRVYEAARQGNGEAWVITHRRRSRPRSLEGFSRHEGDRTNFRSSRQWHFNSPGPAWRVIELSFR